MTKLPKVVLAQINTTPNDFAGNFAKIRIGIDKALEKGADLVVFPELTIPGYSVKDLVYETGFIEKNLEYLRAVVDYTKGFKTKVVVGYIDRNRTGFGKPFKNMLAVICDGVVEATYQKQLLPFYDVFDEGRYFEPGKELAIIDLCGMKWGLAICEDLWNDKGTDDYLYSNNPLEQYRKIGIKNIISINASPYHYKKEKKRIEILNKSFQDLNNLIYVNLIGGQDDLIFDGHSLIISNKTILHYEEDMKESYSFVDMNASLSPFYKNNKCVSDFNNRDFHIRTIADLLELSLGDYVRKNRFTGVVLGSSGGIDSALVATIASRAIGADNVHAIRMPSKFSSKGSLDDALQLHENLKCNDYLVPISHEEMAKHIDTNLVKGNLGKLNSKPNPIAYENIQARIRGMTVMHFSNLYGLLPITTGNKSEISVGYCTLYGDTNGGFAPISDLWKTFVKKVATYYTDSMGYIPESILTKLPSAELNTNQWDEKELLPYPILDSILYSYVEEKVVGFDAYTDWWDNWPKRPYGLFGEGSENSIPDFIRSQDAKKHYEKIERLVIRAEFKRRQLAPGTKVSPVAFGSGRRLPISRG